MSIFPTRVLLATEGSRDAELALATAVDLANSTSSELHVVTAAPGNPDAVYASHENAFRYETYEEAMKAVGKDTQEILDEQARKVEQADGEVAKAHLTMGRHRDQAIVGLADEIGADLIVMGNRGLGA